MCVHQVWEIWCVLHSHNTFQIETATSNCWLAPCGLKGWCIGLSLSGPFSLALGSSPKASDPYRSNNSIPKRGLPSLKFCVLLGTNLSHYLYSICSIYNNQFLSPKRPMITTIALATTSFLSHNHHFFFAGRIFKIWSLSNSHLLTLPEESQPWGWNFPWPDGRSEMSWELIWWFGSGEIEKYPSHYQLISQGNNLKYGESFRLRDAFQDLIYTLK